MQVGSVFYLSDPAEFQEKEHLYNKTRRLEGRILPDEDVKMLPKCSKSNPYLKEWQWRERTCKRFLKYVKEFFKRVEPNRGAAHLKILDLGCGNGWMSNFLAEQANALVWAVDLNQEELEQAARLFGSKNLQFIYADIGRLAQESTQKPDLEFPAAFDLIVLAAAVQYFPNLELLIQTLRKLLTTNGEIHLLDSNFYSNQLENSAAKNRSLRYYQKLGVPEMADFYQHHLWTDAIELGAENLNKSLKIKFLQKIKQLPPFPWLRFRKLR